MSIANLPYTVFASYERANAVALHLNQNEVEINQEEDSWTYTICVHNNGRALVNIYDENGIFVGLL